MTGRFELFDSTHLNTDFNETFVKHRTAAREAIGKYETACQGASEEVRAAINELKRKAASASRDHHAAVTANNAERLGATRDAADTARKTIDDFLRGNTEHVLESGAKVQLSDTVGKEVRDAYVGAQEATRRVNKSANGMFGILTTRKEGFTNALKHNRDQMNFFAKDMEFGARSKAFGHAAVSVGAVAAMGDAVFRSKNSDGENRSAMGRLAEFVVGGAVGSYALLGGKAAAVIR